MVRKNIWGISIGAGLILLGLIFLVGQLLQINLIGALWPGIILLVGAAFFIGMFSGGRELGALAIPGSIITTIGLILFVQNLFDMWFTWTYAWALIIASVGLGLVIFGQRSQIPELRKVGRVVISVGLVLFFVFGVFFELGASLFSPRRPSGILWSVLLILLGLYVIFGRRLTRSAQVDRSVMSFDGTSASQSPAASSMVEGIVVEPAAMEQPAAEEQPAAMERPAAEERPITAEQPAVVEHPKEALDGIRRIIFRALGDMTIIQGEREELVIEASQAFKEHLRSQVRGDTLEITYEQDWLDWLNPANWSISSSVRFTLYVRDLEFLDAAGLGNVTIPGLAARSFEITHSGTGNVTLRQAEIEALVVRQAGVGVVEIEGRANQQNVDLSGTGSYHAARLESQLAFIHLSGVGSATIWVRERLEASVSGAGSIEYFGSPLLSQQVSGLGSVRKLGERR